MARPMFTPEELEELRRADAELDETFVLTSEEYKASSRRDREALHDRKGTAGNTREAYNRALSSGTRESLNETKRAWHRANYDRIRERKKEYYRKTRERRLEWQREYARKKKAQNLSVEVSS